MPLTITTNSPALVVPAPSSTATNAALGTNGLRDIKPPVEVPSSWQWLWWLAGALALAALLWWGWRYWKKKQVKAAAPAKLVPVHERARQKLQEALNLIDQPEPF